MNDRKKLFRPGITLMLAALALVGCATAAETPRSLYGAMPREELARTTKQLDAMGVHYEVRNGNEIFLTQSERAKIRQALSGQLSNPNFKISVETDGSP